MEKLGWGWARRCILIQGTEEKVSKPFQVQKPEKDSVLSSDLGTN